MKKKPIKKRTKKKQRSIIELHAWVTPFGGAKYWEGMIGEVVSMDKKDAKVHFHYQRGGLKLKKPEEWAFPIERLKLVPDFRARVIKHASNAPSLGQAEKVPDEDVNMYGEDYVPPTENPTPPVPGV